MTFGHALDSLQHTRYTESVLRTVTAKPSSLRSGDWRRARSVLLTGMFGCVLACTGKSAQGTDSDPAVAPTLAAPGRPGSLIPLYAYPTDPSFAALIAHKRKHPGVPMVAVINPGTTGAGPRSDPEFARAIRELSAASIVVAGYVSLGYGAREPAAAMADIDNYRAWYPQLSGIFFDELSTRDDTHAFHVSLLEHARAAGFTLSLGNPGTMPNPASVEAFDVLVVYESPGAPDVVEVSALREAHVGGEFALLSYDVDTLDLAFVREAASHASYLYLTDDVHDNPWDTLPPYFDALLGELEALARP